MRVKPLAIDLYCGLGGWAEGFLAEGWDVVGFDIERHDYGLGAYPGQLVLQDVLSVHGNQFSNAASVIVASPPCQFFSRLAMPFRVPWNGTELERRRNLALSMFWSCFRIAHEANLPLIVENVRGAQKWVGGARFRYGSFYLWGDVPALMPSAGSIKNSGGSWFAIGSPGQTNVGQNPDGRKVPRERDCGIEGAKNGGDWFGPGADCSLQRRASSGSSARKAASAQIAKIPFPLAQHIARVYKPVLPLYCA